MNFTHKSKSKWTMAEAVRCPDQVIRVFALLTHEQAGLPTPAYDIEPPLTERVWVCVDTQSVAEWRLNRNSDDDIYLVAAEWNEQLKAEVLAEREAKGANA